MTIKIAVFGRTELIHRLQDYTEAQTDIEIVPFEYADTNEILDLIDQAFTCDTYVFLESIAYLYAKEYLEKKRLPAMQISFDQYMILTSFYRLKHLEDRPLNRLSIDVLNKNHVDEVLTELLLHEKNIYTYGYGVNHPVEIQKVVDFHQTLWEKGKIDYALTSIKEVKDNLQANDVPVSFMQIPKINMIDVIERAKSVTLLNKNKSAQIVAGYVHIKYIKEDNNKQKAVDHLHRILREFSHKTHASILPMSENQFVLFGTRGILDHITNHYRDFPLLQEIKEFLNIEVDIGFGLGLTAQQAENHAQLALDKCKESEVGRCYIVNDQQELIGPLGVKKHFDTSRLYQALIHRARLNNELSYNFIDFITTRNNEPFSSHDVATFYQVTKRSAERTVNKLLSGEVIKVVGEEKPYVKGRPRKLFQINV